MKPELQALLGAALENIARRHGVDIELSAEQIQFTPPKDLKHGDLSTNLALVMSKKLGMTPKSLAESLAQALDAHPAIDRVKVEGPGFINLFLARANACQVVLDILKQGDEYGNSTLGQGKRVHMEYVSANPTGPLHVGHGRGAAFGASLANILKAAGYEVHREYYVNDAGRQMNILALSVWIRYLSLQGVVIELPSNAYQGDYIISISETLVKDHGDRFKKTPEEILQDIPSVSETADEPEKKAQLENRMDALIKRAQTLLGQRSYKTLYDAGLRAILDDIRNDLEAFGVTYDRWFSERSLSNSNKTYVVVDRLSQQGLMYLNQGNTWFKSTRFGDDKDRVVIRENGQPTYFASDIAYHLEKLEAGYDQLINIWGADHHGYIARVSAAIQGLSPDNPAAAEKLKVLLVQFAILYRNGERIPMSTRSGSFVTLRALREEVGNDAARFFYVQRKSEQHMDFDLDLAKSQTKDNPVYYIQYAHARICQLMRKAGISTPKATTAANTNLASLTQPSETKLIKKLDQFSTLLMRAARDHEPHLIAHYLRELAGDFHGFYNDEPILTAEAEIKTARLALCAATQTVIKRGLALLGVSAPSEM